MKTGLVLEGGAMRGLYTAGVLDILNEYDIKVDALYNLYVVYGLLDNSRECDNLVSDMRKFMLADSDVNGLISRAKKKIIDIKSI